MSVLVDVVDSLHLLNYPSFDESTVEHGVLDDVAFVGIVSWISTQLRSLLKLESNVHAIEKFADFSFFQREFEEFIQEMKPPFSLCTSSLVDRLNVLNYLCGELFAARLVSKKRNRVIMNESETAKDLKAIVMSLKLGKPPENITSSTLFKKLDDTIIEMIATKKLTFEDPALLKKGMHLNLKQWDALKTIESLLMSDYSLRRETLLTRCDCTVGSFKWKYSNDKNMQLQIEKVYSAGRNQLNVISPVTIASALAARQSDCDIRLNSVVSTNHQPCVISTPSMMSQANLGKQQRLSLHKYVIGYVPDRGGRSSEQPPPVTETFEEQQRVREQQQNRGGYSSRGSRGGFSGVYHQRSSNLNRVQGAGWNNYGSDQRMYSAPVFDQHPNNQYQYEKSDNGSHHPSGRGWSRGRGSNRRGHQY